MSTNEPSKALIDRLTLEVIAAAGASLDPNVLVTLAIKAGYRAATEPGPPAGSDKRLTAKVKALKASGLTAKDISVAYGLDLANVRAILRTR